MAQLRFSPLRFRRKERGQCVPLVLTEGDCLILALERVFNETILQEGTVNTVRPGRACIKGRIR